MAAIETHKSTNLSKRQRLDMIKVGLENERASFISHWREVADVTLPYRVRFTTAEANRGNRRNQKIIDNTSTLAARTLRAGMMGGITSPARPWFRLTTPDPELSEFGSVKVWLHIVTERMRTIFLKSNLYNALPVLYGDLGVFGTAAMILDEDDNDFIRLSPMMIGSYSLGVDSAGRVNTFFREFSMTVRQLVEKFATIKPNGNIDWSNFSSYVKELWERGNLDARIDVVHAILPNREFSPQRLESKYKRFASIYYEAGGSSNGVNNQTGYLQADVDRGRFLRESGYDYFPVLAPRWETGAGDAYGTSCPGMDAIGDIKQLQAGEKRIQEAIEKMIKPPMTGGSDLLNTEKSLIPGGFTVSGKDPNQAFRPVFQLDPRVQEMEFKQNQCRERIKRAFYEDLFLMMAYTDRRQVTAREIEERHEEKLLALGPVLEQLGQDLHNPLIDNTFEIMLAAGQIPPPPEEIQGMPLKVEYISVMAQAQKLVGLGGLERYSGFVTSLVQVNPDVLDKVDFDEMVDEYADAVGVSPKVNRAKEAVEEMRAARAQAQQAQAMNEGLNQLSGTAKNLSQSDMEGNNALTQVVGGALTAGDAAQEGEI